MSVIVPKDNLIDDLYLHKHVASNKMKQVLSMIDDYGSQKMIKTASSNKDQIVTLFSNLLSYLNMKTDDNDIKETINKMSIDSNDFDKSASIDKSSKERKDEIKIVSKSIKDSHYQVDISKDVIKRGDKQVFMVSCYAKDAYLGRYLIKRNYFYTADREKFANEAYDEILVKIGSIKDRYYNDIIAVSGIFTQIKQILDGVISEIKIDEDSIGTNVRR